MHLFLIRSLALLSLPVAVLAADIPDRPEKLAFPPLTFEPPNPADYRVQLKAGPVAYVVADKTLPLVNVSILARTGGYLDPQGMEGVAEFTGYLLARGGTESRKAEELEERLGDPALARNDLSPKPYKHSTHQLGRALFERCARARSRRWS
jgi:hypothetical protein